MYSFDEVKKDLVLCLRTLLTEDFLVFENAANNPLHAEVAIIPSNIVVFIIVDEHDHGERYVEWLKWQLEAERLGLNPLLFFYEDSADIRKFADSLVKLLRPSTCA